MRVNVSLSGRRDRRDGGRGRWLPGAALATVAAVVAGLVVPSWGVADTPSSALQAVQVTVSPTGALTGMTSTVIERTPTSFTSHSTALDPSRLASRLPVRVSTTYLLNGRPGTDLSKLAGASGRVEIDVTVTNTTLRPERVTHRTVDGLPAASYALVATPLTVVAQADLPSGTAGSVVTGSTGDARPEPATNGVLTGAGTDDVVWSALLAPPQLSPTTTFRLVEQTSHFVPPAIHLTVQPGVQTDPSLARLLGTSVGGARADDLVAVQNAALMLVDRIDGRLGRVTADLATIGRSLHDQADEIGPQATAQLRTTDDDIRVAIGGLQSDLTDLDQKVAGRLSHTTGRAGAAIRAVVASIDDRLGMPGPHGFPTSPPTPAHRPSGTPGCSAPQTAAQAPAAGSLIARLEAISGQVQALAASTGACQTALAKVLADEIGTPGGACPAADTTVLCGLGTVAQQSQSLADQLSSTTLQSAVDQLDGTARQALDDDVSTLGNRLHDLRHASDGLSGSLGSLHLDQVVSDIQAAGHALDSLTSDIAGLNAVATTQLGLLNDTSDPLGEKGVGSEVTDLANLVCSAINPGNPAGAAALLPLLEGAGATCNGTTVQADPDHPAPGYQTSLAGFVANDEKQWQQVAEDTAAGGALHDDVQQVSDALTDLFGNLPDGGDLGKAVSDLQAAVAALTDGHAADPGECTAAGLPALQQLECDVQDYDAKQQQAHDELTGSLSQLRTLAAANASDATALTTTAADAATKATDGFNRLLGGLSASAARTAVGLLRAGGRVIGTQEQRLAGTRRIEGHRLSGAAQSAIGDLATAFGSARHDETVAAGQLTGDVRDVITNLGDPSGSGLLGAVAADAALARARNADVRRAGSTGLAYTTVGQTAIDEDLLQRAQLAQGLDQAAGFPAFGIRAPAPKTRTVFVFTIGAS